MTISSVESTLRAIFHKVKEFVLVILKHNILFHSSAISYYAALSIAPFLLILLQIGALLGHQLQIELISQTYFVLGPEVGQITEMIFSNANEGINLASISGLIGGVTLLFTASIVFIQLRFSLDSIYGHYDADLSRSFLDVAKERIISMVIVIFIAILFFLSLFVSNIVRFMAGNGMEVGMSGYVMSNMLSFIINMMMFTAVYYFTPTRTPKFSSTVKMAVFTSVAFIFGKILMGLYFKNVAISSVYGAAGTLLVFLVWAYYSSFTMFLSVEGFLFLNPKEHGES